MSAATGRVSIPPPKLPAKVVAEARVKALEAELAQANDATREALLCYEMGALTELVLGDVAGGIERYESARRADPHFRPPLLALMRLARARHAHGELARLHEAELLAARCAHDRALAQVNRALALAHDAGRDAEAQQLLAQAADVDTGSALAPLLLEQAHRSAGDLEAALAQTVRLVERLADPILRGVLSIEVAEQLAAQGNHDAARDWLAWATAEPEVVWRATATMARLAEAHALPAMQSEALRKLAALARHAADLPQAASSADAQQPLLPPRSLAEARAACALVQGPDPSACHDQAVALQAESARLALDALGDAAQALTELQEALEQAPRDPWLCWLALEAAWQRGDTAHQAYAIQALNGALPAGTDTALLSYLAALRAIDLGEADQALALAEQAVRTAPGSVSARALLEDRLLESGQHDVLAARLVERSQSGEAEARAEAAWRAGMLMAEQGGGLQRAHALLARAVELARDKAPILRELHGIAMRCHDHPLTREAATALRAASEDAAERAALARETYHLLLGEFQDTDAALALLSDALDDPDCTDWAPDAARLLAALQGDEVLLARAHRTVARAAADPALHAAHLCAAARAALRAGDAEAALADVATALEQLPTHAYALALERAAQVASGRIDAALEAARQAPAQERAEVWMQLGAAAEARGALDAAATAYLQAADGDPQAPLPAWALWRLGEARDDAALRDRGLRTLAQRERHGEPKSRRFTLALAEHLMASGASEPAQTELQRTLEDPELDVRAAWALGLVPLADALEDARVSALARLLEQAPPDLAAGLARELASLRLDDPQGPVPHSAVSRLRAVAAEHPFTDWLEALTSRTDRDRARAWLRLAEGLRASHPERADLWIALGLHGTWTALTSSEDATSAPAPGEALRAWGEHAPASAAAAFAVEEAEAMGLGSDDRDVVGERLAHVRGAERHALRVGRARAWLRAGRHADAYGELSALVEADPGDLVSWEGLRVAARGCQAWETLVEACDVLASHARGAMQAELFEEAGVTLEDHLGRPTDAQARYARAFDVDPRRDVAFHRLHDRLAATGDAPSLTALIAARVSVEEDPDALLALYYEQARLLRAAGDRHGALVALDHVRMLDDTHLGALGLSAEIHASLEHWSEAADALRRLARAGVPAAQRRMAHLGAADLLEQRLGDLGGALVELDALASAGLADARVHARRATLSAALGESEAAVTAWTEAAGLAVSADAAAYHRAAGGLLRDRLQAPARAARSYAAALDADATDVASCLALLSLDPGEGARRASACAQALHARLGETPTDAALLRKLRNLAGARGQVGLARSVLAALVALREADDEERQAHAALANATTRVPSGRLDADGLTALAPWLSEGFAGLAPHVDQALVALESPGPGRLGLQRRDRLRPDHPLRQALEALTGAFGVTVDSVYQGGNDPHGIAAWAQADGSSSWALGAAVALPLAPSARLRIGMLSLGLRHGVACLLDRTPGAAAEGVWAALQAANLTVPTPLWQGMDTPPPERVAQLRKAMPRRVRKALEASAPELPSQGPSLFAHAQASFQALLRAGLIASDDLGAGLTALARAYGRDETPTGPQLSSWAPARTLLAFWLSDAMQAARVAIGYEA